MAKDPKTPRKTMFWSRAVAAIVVALTCCSLGQNGVVQATLLRGSQENSLDESIYSFEQYLKDFRKDYADQPADVREQRERIFWQNMETMRRHNAGRNVNFVLGVNSFMDLESHELPTGYDKSYHAAWQPLQLNTRDTTPVRNLRGGGETDFLQKPSLPFELEEVSKLPASVDWRTRGVVTPIKDQGRCGSCWAFASAATLESHIALRTQKMFTFSTQELVSCTPNYKHCGGLGGCAGATAEIAFDFVAKNGILMEDQFGYQSFHGKSVECPFVNSSKTTESLAERKLSSTSAIGVSSFLEEAVATIDGFLVLPSNNYTVLMNAIARTGPVAVSVACTDWHLYQSGVFEDASNYTATAFDINHLVVLAGYGTDPKTGVDFWLVRNSWGPRWGEDGYIRLRRVDPSTLDDPDEDCGSDLTPADGVACTKDDSGKDILPSVAKVCGTSGILFNSAIPFGGRLLGGHIR